MTEYKWFVFDNEGSNFKIFEIEEDARNYFNRLVERIEEYAYRYGEYCEYSDVSFGRIYKHAMLTDVKKLIVSDLD